MTKYIFVTGGVISGIGKGITTASIGRLLIDRGFSVMVVKIDPYINSDAGTMDPFQHGKAVEQMYSFSFPHKFCLCKGAVWSP